jgi:hypothetical protein
MSGHASDLWQANQICFYQRCENRILSSDLLVLKTTHCVCTLLGRLDEDVRGGFCSKRLRYFRRGPSNGERGFETHRLSVSSAQVRYSSQRLWNNKNAERAIGNIASRPAVKHVSELL